MTFIYNIQWFALPGQSVILLVVAVGCGVFQDSWHSLANFYAASFLGVSGFNVTAPIDVV